MNDIFGTEVVKWYNGRRGMEPKRGMSCRTNMRGLEGRKHAKHEASGSSQQKTDFLIEREADIRVLLNALRHENYAHDETWQEISLKRQLEEITHLRATRN